MNYHHGYHAGGFADVFKHTALIAILDYLIQKPQPCAYIDTNAGLASYNLRLEKVKSSQEHKTGISVLLNRPVQSSLLAKYLRIVEQCNRGRKHIQYYPGSSWFANTILRAEDQLILCEYNTTTHHALKKQTHNWQRTFVKQVNFYEALPALIPPKQKRGLVFIDPPYEDPKELFDLPKRLQAFYKKWPTGCYAIWYPIKGQASVNRLYQNLCNVQLPNILVAEQCLFPNDVAQRLNGSGMLFINPPWQLEKQLSELLQELPSLLNAHPKAANRVFSLDRSHI